MTFKKIIPLRIGGGISHELFYPQTSQAYVNNWMSFAHWESFQALKSDSICNENSRPLSAELSFSCLFWYIITGPVLHSYTILTDFDYFSYPCFVSLPWHTSKFFSTGCRQSQSFFSNPLHIAGRVSWSNRLCTTWSSLLRGVRIFWAWKQFPPSVFSPRRRLRWRWSWNLWNTRSF